MPENLRVLLGDLAHSGRGYGVTVCALGDVDATHVLAVCIQRTQQRGGVPRSELDGVAILGSWPPSASLGVI